MGGVAGVLCFFAVSWLKPKLGYDDSLDVFGIQLRQQFDVTDDLPKLGRHRIELRIAQPQSGQKRDLLDFVASQAHGSAHA